MQRYIFVSFVIALLLAAVGVEGYSYGYDYGHSDLDRRHGDHHHRRQAVQTPSPVQPGQVGNCIGWRYVQPSDTCSNIVTRYQAAPVSLTLAHLLQWNPALKSDCSGLTPATYVCVRIGATQTTTTTTAPTTTVTPTPIQSGQVNNCIGWRYTQTTDTCANIVSRFSSIGLTLANFVKYNPAVGSTSSCTITPKYFVCVQVGPPKTTTTTTTSKTTTTTTTTSKTTTTTTTSGGVSTPTPIQSGQVSNCVGWRYTQTTDTCANIVSRFSSIGLTLAKFTQWNPAVVSTGTCTITPKFFVCVQIAGSTTTTTTTKTTTTSRPTASTYWLDELMHQGKAPYAQSGYAVYRNVKDFGAKGDGTTDDTAAIQNAIASGSRCGLGCDSLTTKPALVYFPPGTYIVSSAIATYYHTHLIGHPINLPRLKATAGFTGYAIIEGNPYNNGVNWHGPTNNFYKVVRNFILDTTLMPASSYGTGIHWQTAQATSLSNIIFYSNTAAGTVHQGIYIENGSGGYMSDLVFNGGKFGAWMGNQQFTLRNLTFNNCDTGIYLAWGWAWHFKSLNFNNVRIGLDMSSSADGALTVGSVIVADSKFTNVQVGIATTKSSSSTPKTANSLILDNIQVNNCPIVVGVSGSVKLAGPASGSSIIAMWGQGRSYSQSQQSGVDFESAITGFARPAGLLDNSGKILERSKPQYADSTIDDVLSARDLGAKGDASTDDTNALQAAINKAAEEGKILFIDYGVYVVSKTIYVPSGSRIFGEVWPLILGSGAAFSNQANPIPIFQIGKPGESGFAEAQNLVISTRGAMRGAILIEWNLASTGEVSGLYDVHARVGGFTGSNLEYTNCPKNPSSTNVNANCAAAFMLMKVGSTASRAMFENVWLWTADHDLDLPAHNQITVFTGRGLLVESKNPIWLYGTASEHNVLYQYQFSNAANVYMGLIQTETPYYQANPIAPLPFSVNTTWSDPDYASICGNAGNTCKKSYGVRIQNSQNILCYGAGLYSFFENYEQSCLDTETCQKYMVSIENSVNIRLYNTNTKGSENILTTNGWSAPQGANKNTFAETVALFQS